MPETKAVHLVAGLNCIVAVGKADKRKTLGHASVAVLGKEDAGDAAEPLEHVAQFLLLGHLRDLFQSACRHLDIAHIHNEERESQLTFVTRSVAKSSRSLYLPPMRSPPPAAPARIAGGTYDPFFPEPAAPTEAPPAADGSSPIPAATSVAPASPMGAIVSLYGQRAVKCWPLQIRHLTCLSRSLSFIACALGSLASSLASLRQLIDGRKMMFSPTVVVSAAGPDGSLAESPNLAHVLRSATRGLTTSRRTT